MFRDPSRAEFYLYPTVDLFISLRCHLRVGWGGISWNDMAFNTMAGGLLGALAAAIPEYLDYRSFRNPTPSNRTMADADQAFHCGVVRGQFVAPNGK